MKLKETLKFDKRTLISLLVLFAFAGILSIKNLIFDYVAINPTYQIQDFSKIYYIIKDSTYMVMFQSLPLFILLLPGLLFKKKQFLYYVIIDVLFSLFLIGNVLTLRLCGKFLTFDFFYNNFPIIKNSINIPTLFFEKDIFFIFDIVIILILLTLLKIITNKTYIKLKGSKLLFALLLICTSFSLFYICKLSENKDIGFKINLTEWAPYNTIFQTSPLVYDVLDFKHKLFETNRNITSEESKFVSNWIENNNENLSDNEYKGLLKDKNLIVIQVEAFDNLSIGQKIADQEITPNINKLLNHSLYFNNIYDQTNGGVSSDCDLIFNTSVFPIRDKSTFLEYPNTTYNSLPKLLSSNGYSTMMLHGELGGNWNFKVADSYIGFDKVLDLNHFNIPKGLKPHFGSTTDNLIFNTFLSKIENLKKPFLGHVVTLDTHAYFNSVPPEEYKLKLPADLNNQDSNFGKYLQCLNYLDTQIGEFIKNLKEKNLYDNSVIVITGDHGGLKKYCQKDIPSIASAYPWVGTDLDPKVPLIIHSKDIQGKKIDLIGGQIDIMPTIAYVMGIDTNKFTNTAQGKILLNTNKNFTILNDGRIIGNVTPDQKSHLTDAFKVSDIIIKKNYFKDTNK